MGKPVLLHILDVNELPILEQIYVSGTSDAVKEVIAELCGLAKASKRLAVKYSRLKEWVSGRRPIPIFFLKNIIELSNKQGQIIRRVNLGNIYISCKYSPHKIKFPKEVTKELAYIVGIILGDGCLAGDKNNSRGNWTIAVCFDNEKHCKLYRNYFNAVFGINPKYYWTNKGYYDCYIASKALHWFFQCFFEIKNGIKNDSILIPSRVYKDQNILSHLVEGLFDSDGTVVPSRRTVKFASTSKAIVQQLEMIFKEWDIPCHSYVWTKKGGFKPLYSICINSKKGILAFADKVGFQHPAKKEKLKNLCEAIYY